MFGGMRKNIIILNYIQQCGEKVAVSDIIRDLEVKEKDVKKAVEFARKKMGIVLRIEDGYVIGKIPQRGEPVVQERVVYMIKCQNCDHDNLQGTQKCTNCGAPL